jgi:hypothetical protein
MCFAWRHAPPLKEQSRGALIGTTGGSGTKNKRHAASLRRSMQICPPHDVNRMFRCFRQTENRLTPALD